MADECVDIANQEQLAVCFRYVDDSLVVHEEFMGLYLCSDIKSETIVATLEDVILRFDFKLSNCRGQCYDGGSNMAGSKTGVKTRFLEKEPCALYMHCYGHALSLSIGDAIKLVPLLRSTLDTAHEISKLFQYSPKRTNLFKNVKAEVNPDSGGFQTLCLTHWTVRHETIGSILTNYETLLSVWEEMLEDRIDSDTRARVHGFSSQMKAFNFFFGLCLVHTILMHTDNLSKTLQHTKMSAAEGQHIAKLTINTLQQVRGDVAFSLFWGSTTQQADKLGISPPRKRMPPKQHDDGMGESTIPTLPTDHYKRIYFKAVDTVTQCIKDRFDQEGYRTYSKLEQVLLTKDVSAASIDDLLVLYRDDFDRDALLAQLKLLHSNYTVSSENASVHDLVTLVQGFSSAEKAMVSQVVKLIRLLLVMPATNSVKDLFLL